ncbi:Pycsar system effector family protein [Hyphomicrobium sp.]|uniref:Pycsar system effector family protein n=1 Tax=Hyphomicrobium sp. TaxID=82 RepID=UPI002FE0835E
MKDEPLREAATDQLDRVLAFFPRVDTKISALFAVDVAMLALLAVNARLTDLQIWYLVLAYILSVAALGTSVWFLYRASYPVLDGGHQSLVYFREIARRTEATYLKEMCACSDTAFTDDLLGQVWRNAEILTLKFDAVKWSFISTALALPTWFVALAAASAHHAELIVR